MNLNMYVSTWHLSRGYEPERIANSAHPSIVPFQNFPTARRLDRDRLRRRTSSSTLLCARARPGVDDRRSALRDAWPRAHEHREACVDELAAVLLGDGSATWLERLRAAGVPCGPVNDMAGAVSDPQTLARDLIAETEHPVLGTVRQIRSPLRVDGRLTELRAAPRRGEHTREVLVGAVRLRGRGGRPARRGRRLRRRRGLASRLARPPAGRAPPRPAG